MEKNNKQHQNWLDAKYIYIGVFPVPGSFGVNAMDTVGRYMLNTVNVARSTTIIAYTAERRILLVLHVNSEGGREMAKYYPPPGHRFEAPEELSSTVNRCVVLTKTQLRELTAKTVPLRPRLQEQ